MAQKELESMTRNELLAIAREKGIKTGSSIRKDDLIALIRIHTQPKGSTKTSGKPAKPKSPGVVKLSDRPARNSKNAKPARGGRSDRKPSTRNPKPAKRQVAPVNVAPKEVPLANPSGQMPSSHGFHDPAQAAKFQVIAGPETFVGSETPELPDNYGDHKLVLLPRDPFWAFAYWELQHDRVEEVYRSVNCARDRVRWILRVIPLENTLESIRDHELAPGAQSWYFCMAHPGASLRAEIGLMNPQGEFVVLAESNTLRLPAGRPSDLTDDRWMTTDKEFQKIFSLSGGYSFAHPDQAFSGSSANLLQGSEAVQHYTGTDLEPIPAPFEFSVETEVVLYGQAPQGTRIALEGQPVELRTDGSFTTRFALPDGKLEYGLTVVSPDGKETHTIESVVSRETRYPLTEIKENSND